MPSSAASPRHLRGRLVVVAALIVAVALVHLGITNLAACIALVVPVAVTVGEIAGLNPIVCGLIVTIAVDAVILYPVQTAANLVACETGYFDARDVRRFGLVILALATLLIVAVVLPYWRALGLPLTAR